MKTELRISGHKDYIAVDIVDDSSKILSTPLYLKVKESAEILYKDDELKKWYKTEIRISEDFKQLECKDIDTNSDYIGLEWKDDFEMLLNKNYIKFKNT